MNFIVNKLKQDEFGRISGILAVNKPAGMTSHDVIDEVRDKINTRKVGHAGTLDPFATGVLIVLVGKATSLSHSLVGADKEYQAQILFGIGTDSADIEGEVTATEPELKLDKEELKQTLEKFTPEYKQYVPVFSSVKVDGQKLRVLARQADKHEVETTESGKVAKFYLGDDVKTISLPSRKCQIPKLDLLETNTTVLTDINLTDHRNMLLQKIENQELPTATIKVTCSKGTYIRTLAEDIGLAMPNPMPAMLIELTRTRADRITLSHAIELDEVGEALIQ